MVSRDSSRENPWWRIDEAVDCAEIGGSTGPEVVACAVELRLVESMSFIEDSASRVKGDALEEAVVGAEPQGSGLVV